MQQSKKKVEFIEPPSDFKFKAQTQGKPIANEQAFPALKAPIDGLRKEVMPKWPVRLIFPTASKKLVVSPLEVSRLRVAAQPPPSVEEDEALKGEFIKKIGAAFLLTRARTSSKIRKTSSPAERRQFKKVRKLQPLHPSPRVLKPTLPKSKLPKSTLPRPRPPRSTVPRPRVPTPTLPLSIAPKHVPSPQST